MNISFFLAKVIGFYLCIVNLAILARRKEYLIILEEFARQKSLIIISGALGLIIGLLWVFSHSIWATDWRTIITILGWFTLIKSILYLFFPDLPKYLIASFTKSKFYIIDSLAFFIIGVYLIYHGFAHSI